MLLYFWHKGGDGGVNLSGDKYIVVYKYSDQSRTVTT